MQRQTKLIVERFTNLEDILYSPARWNSGTISLFNRTEQVFFFFEDPNTFSLDTASLYSHLDGELLEFALALLGRYYQENSYLVQPSSTTLKEHELFIDSNQLADLVMKYKLEPRELKRIPAPDLIVAGKHYWSQEKAEAFCNRMKN